MQTRTRERRNPSTRNPFNAKISSMNTLFAFPDWVPWWVPMVLLVPALLYALAFLFMPFSVLGVKTRLEVIEDTAGRNSTRNPPSRAATPGGPAGGRF